MDKITSYIFFLWCISECSKEFNGTEIKWVAIAVSDCHYNKMYINNKAEVPIQHPKWHMIALQSEPCEQTCPPRDTRRDSVWFKVGIKHQISTRLTPTTGWQFQTLPARKLFMEIFSTTAHTHIYRHTPFGENTALIARGLMLHFLRRHSVPVLDGKKIIII